MIEKEKKTIKAAAGILRQLVVFVKADGSVRGEPNMSFDRKAIVAMVGELNGMVEDYSGDPLEDLEVLLSEKRKNTEDFLTGMSTIIGKPIYPMHEEGRER